MAVTTPTPTPTPPAAAAQPDDAAVWPYRWTREAYERLVEHGIFGPGDHVQLIEGEIVEMAPQNPPHIIAVGLAEDAVRRAFGARYHTRTQGPVALGDYSVPEPDVAVVRGRRRDYLSGHPGAPGTIVLAVEVADTTLSFDRNRKASLYAAQGIPEYWIVNLQERVLEVYRDSGPMPAAPYGAGYHTRRVVVAGGHISPLAAPDKRVAVDDLLP